jgi:hypothetical protein
MGCAVQAASDAYDATLAPVHTYFVRMAVKTSMYLLPDRATFLASIGETGPLPASQLHPSVHDYLLLNKSPSPVISYTGMALASLYVHDMATE